MSRSGAGDGLRSLATQKLAGPRNCSFALGLLHGTMSLENFLSYFGPMYIVVVGFNQALFSAMTSVDHVREAWLKTQLAAQYHEEMSHNSMYRDMLDHLNFNHRGLYEEWERVRVEYSKEITCWGRNPSDFGEQLPGKTFPTDLPIWPMALTHFICGYCADPQRSIWPKLACLGILEMMICDMVTDVIMPGIRKSTQFHLGPKELKWWDEHYLTADSAEARHLQMAIHLQNRYGGEDLLQSSFVADIAAGLFAATMTEHIHGEFPVEKYQIKS